MDKETKDIVKLIAGIQIESLNSIKRRGVINEKVLSKNKMIPSVNKPEIKPFTNTSKTGVQIPPTVV